MHDISTAISTADLSPKQPEIPEPVYFRVEGLELLDRRPPEEIPRYVSYAEALADYERSRAESGYATVLSLGAVGLTSLAVIKFLENGRDDITAYGVGGAAAVAAYVAFNSFRDRRALS